MKREIPDHAPTVVDDDDEDHEMDDAGDGDGDKEELVDDEIEAEAANGHVESNGVEEDAVEE